jgi:hypothetical protein
LYEFARGLYEKKMENTMFLRAERRPDGARTFRMIRGEPLLTSFGQDLYDSVFTPRQTASPGRGAVEGNKNGHALRQIS